MNLTQIIEKAEGEFDTQFGIAGPNRNSDSIGRDAGCDDCFNNVGLREEHKSFLSEKIKEAYEAGFLAGNREGFNAANEINQ